MVGEPRTTPLGGSDAAENSKKTCRSGKSKSGSPDYRKKRAGDSPWRDEEARSCSGRGSTPQSLGSRGLSSERGRPLLWAGGGGCRSDQRSDSGGRPHDAEHGIDRDEHRRPPAMGHTEGRNVQVASMSSRLHSGSGGRRPRARYSMSSSEPRRPRSRGVGHESSASCSTRRLGGRKRRPEEEIKRASRQEEGGEEKSRQERQESQRSRSREIKREKRPEEALKEEEPDQIAERGKKKEKKEEGKTGVQPCQRGRIPRRRQKEVEGKALGEDKRLFVQRYRRGSSQSEEDVQRNRTGPVLESEEAGLPPGSALYQAEEEQLDGVKLFGRLERGHPENREHAPVWRRVEDPGAGREVPGVDGLGIPPGNWEDGLHGYGGWAPHFEGLAPPPGAVLPPSPFEAHLRCDGQGVAHALQYHRLLAGGQGCPSLGYQLAEDQRFGTAGWWHQLPDQSTVGGYPLGAGNPPFATGAGYNPEGAKPRGEGLWRSVTHGDGIPEQRERSWEGGQADVQGQRAQREREGEERREEARGEQEDRLRPTSVLSYEPGVESPVWPEKVGIKMRGFYPRYHGPLSDKTVLILGTEELDSRQFSSLATSASAMVFQPDSEASCPSKKEPPLGLPLSRLGRLVNDRFLEVSLHSQPMGKGSSSTIFPLPTSRDVISRFFGPVGDFVVDWIVAITLALNSYWGGPLFNEKAISVVHGKILESFLHDVQRICDLTDTVDEFDWTSFFRCRTIDYRGEEVKTAKFFSWANIGPALPKEIGVVELRDLCEQGCQYYVDHFPDFLKDRAVWPSVKRSRVMVKDEDWPEVARNLVSRGVCQVIPESEIFRVHGELLLNGLFGVEKGEECDGVPTYRLIMNLVPLNEICLNLAADIAGLPHWLGMNPFGLEPSEGLLISSEDVRCFFYTLALPPIWKPFLAFNREVPMDLQLDGCNGPCYLTAVVLPMGFINSVGVAQHVHRVLVKRSLPQPERDLASREIRKDAPLPESNSTWRVYLDNYDLLEKFPKEVLSEFQGTVAPEVAGLRGSYSMVGMPRHEGKAVARQVTAEVQGALVDGERGLAFPKGAKLIKYVVMALLFCQLERCNQKQVQVICGGLVYFTMFRRQLLGSLNQCWSFIESFNHCGRHWQLVPNLVKLEVLRCVSLVALCRMDFRQPMHQQVTCSDASTSGGGMCCSTGLSPAGELVAHGMLRPEGNAMDGRPNVLSVGLFDGVGCLRLALDLLGTNVAGHISVEKQQPGHRVVEYHFPGSLLLDDVEKVTEADVRGWSLQFGQVDLVLLGAGPPCQGVSGLNASRRGALLDERSSLFIHVQRIKELLQKHFPWCPVQVIMESVASMDNSDQQVMSDSFGDAPWRIDADQMTWCRRPRLYWVTWQISTGPGVSIEDQVVTLSANVELEEFISPGSTKVNPDRAFPTFTTSRPRAAPGHRPAGINHCDPNTVQRWKDDCHRCPPYQYLLDNCLQNRLGELRLPNIDEKELMMGMPLGYTNPCYPKTQRKSQEHLDMRHTLVGNAWCVPVVSWLLGQLLGPLGFTDSLGPQSIMDRLNPSKTLDVRSRLLRPALRVVGPPMPSEPGRLEQLLSRLVSAKGEDILLNSGTEQVGSFQRLRQTVPSRLWKWKIISGWKWKHGKEHINALEMRALEATIKWRVEKLGELRCKFVHLTDSLVCLHTVSRGRSSSKKLRRSVCRLNALLLASGVSPVWGYVHTDQNPADKPSRWAVRTKFRNAKTRS